jgi:hypothetical protein
MLHVCLFFPRLGVSEHTSCGVPRRLSSSFIMHDLEYNLVRHMHMHMHMGNTQHIGITVCISGTDALDLHVTTTRDINK